MSQLCNVVYLSTLVTLFTTLFIFSKILHQMHNKIPAFRPSAFPIKKGRSNQLIKYLSFWPCEIVFGLARSILALRDQFFALQDRFRPCEINFWPCEIVLALRDRFWPCETNFWPCEIDFGLARSIFGLARSFLALQP